MIIEQLSDEALINAHKSIRKMHQDRLDKLNDPINIDRLKARKIKHDNGTNPKFIELMNAINDEVIKRKLI